MLMTPLAMLDDEIVVPMLVGVAIAFIGLSFIIVLSIRSVPARLLLLGMLSIIIAVVLGAILPGIVNLALVMAICGSLIVFAGLCCTIIAWLVQLFKKDPAATQTK